MGKAGVSSILGVEYTCAPVCGIQGRVPVPSQQEVLTALFAVSCKFCNIFVDWFSLLSGGWHVDTYHVCFVVFLPLDNAMLGVPPEGCRYDD